MELKQNSVPECVMLKLQKLKVLSERGEAGEAENAKNLLKSLCEKYGIDEEKLFEEEKHCYEFEVRASVRKLFLQLYTSIYGTSERYMNEVTFWERGSKHLIKCWFTHAEYIEFSQLWDWHRKNFLEERKRMRKLFEHAYVEKFKLYPSETCEEFEELQKKSKKSDLSLNDIWAISSMAAACKNKTYYKQLDIIGEDDEED